MAPSNVQCLHLVWGFDNGAKLLDAAERHGLEGIVSSARRQPIASGAKPLLGENERVEGKF